MAKLSSLSRRRCVLTSARHNAFLFTYLKVPVTNTLVVEISNAADKLTKNFPRHFLVELLVFHNHIEEIAICAELHKYKNIPPRHQDVVKLHTLKIGGCSEFK